ncbi:hypothetical protein BJV77DRAFT_268696 [Russula vinacea]|nr:hypothetical protein BJV77DRAFT_268696 [Russula vinacea]
MIKEKGVQWEEGTDGVMEIRRTVCRNTRAYSLQHATKNMQCLAPVRAARPLRTSRFSSRWCVRRRSCTGTRPHFRS